MGLDVSHDAWHGAYSAFHQWRVKLIEATGGSFREENNRAIWYFHFGPGYDSISHPGLFELLAHSDCDGKISPELCAKIADELTDLLPHITETASGNHIARNGGYKATTRKFIEGARRAAQRNEPLEFL